MTGVLEVIPIVGPITAGAIACLVALGHPAPWGLSQIWYVAIVAAMYTVLRHAEDYFVIPLVIGRLVKLHPAPVIFTLLTGARLVPRRGDDASPVRHPGPVGRGSPSGHRRAADRRRRRASVITNIGSSLLVRGRWGARRSLVGLPWWARLGPDFGGAAWRVRA